MVSQRELQVASKKIALYHTKHPHITMSQINRCEIKQKKRCFVTAQLQDENCPLDLALTWVASANVVM